MRSGGGTHLQCQAGKGDSAGNCEGDLYGVTYEQGATNFVDLYRLRAGAPDMRELVARIKVPFAPGSFHSFGLTSEYAILPLSPFTMDGPSMLEGKDIMHSIKNKGKETPIYLVHLVTGAVQQLTFPTSIFYIHAVNTWQNATHINFDASCFERQQFSLDNPAVALSVLRNKTARDIYHNTQTVRRYSIEFETGEVNELFLTEGPGAIDFPKVNPNNYGLPYCIYYGVEWKHNGRDFGSNALRKHNTCTGEVLFYYEPNNYLSEGIFVPDGGPNANEDDGVLISVRSSGLTNASTFLVLDAHTMTPVSEADLPHRVGWFGHTAWYPDTGAVVA
jgi:carotenoid cleavage dioxygenase-like enzyme